MTENEALEQGICSDFRQLESTVKRLHTRITLYSGFGKTSKQVDALLDARESVYHLVQETKRLKGYLKKV